MQSQFQCFLLIRHFPPQLRVLLGSGCRGYVWRITGLGSSNVLLHWSVSGVVLDQHGLDRAEQLSQWFNSPLYYYSSDWGESVSSWGPASFMATCSPFRQQHFHGILLGPIAHVYWWIWLHIDPEHLYFNVKRRGPAMLKHEFLSFQLVCLFFSPLVDGDIIRQMLPYFLAHLSC